MNEENNTSGMPSMNAGAPEVKPVIPAAPKAPEVNLDTPSNMEAPKAPEEVKPYTFPASIEVVAKLPGFFNNERMPVGSKFNVNESELGLWMTCICPLAEKARKEKLNNKMLAAKAKTAARKAKK